MGRFLKFTPKKEIYDKFEEFLSKLFQITLESNFVQIVASAYHCWSLSIYFLGHYCIILDYTPSLSHRGHWAHPSARGREHSPELCNNFPYFFDSCNYLPPCPILSSFYLFPFNSSSLFIWPSVLVFPY